MYKAQYGVLVGKVEKIIADPANNKTPHYKIYVKTTEEEKYDVLINCRSRDDQCPKVLFFVDENFKNNLLTDSLKELNFGFHEIDYENEVNSNIAIDYIRQDILNIDEMQPLPYDIEGENDLKGLIDKNVKQSLNNEEIIIYVFGTTYNDSGNKGIHNIHMNQGNRGKHYDENQIYHDGCFFLYFNEENKWIAYFLAFQNQSKNTDDKGCPRD